MSIKNYVKLLFLVMFLALCAKMTKKRGCERVWEGVGGKNASTLAIKKKKTLAKNGGAVCTHWYDVNNFIYIYIYI